MIMVGGVVTETIVLPDRIWVKCEEHNSSDQCAIYVERNPKSECIESGDSIWWQAGQAMWTPYSVRKAGWKSKPRQGKDFDIKIRKIGYSGITRPKV